MVIAVFDTNIIIDFLREIPQAGHELGRYDEKVISIVTWIDVMVGAEGREQRTKDVLSGFEKLTSIAMSPSAPRSYADSIGSSCPTRSSGRRHARSI